MSKDKYEIELTSGDNLHGEHSIAALVWLDTTSEDEAIIKMNEIKKKLEEK